MSKRFWRRRTILTATVIVALTVGIVFASIPFLPVPPTRHGSIRTPVSHTIQRGNESYPGFYGLSLPGLSTNESFEVGVSIINGVAGFCVMESQPYENWALAYNQTRDPGSRFPSQYCILQTQQTAQDTLKFLPTSPGTWVVIALNTGPFNITVYFLPA